MNKKLFLGMFAAAGMLLATSCSNDELDMVQSGNEAQITFSVGAKGGIATRAISDGKSADKLVWAVYNEAGTLLNVFKNGENYVGQDTHTSVPDMTTTAKEVTVNLAKGQKYHVLFWAQDADCTAYNTADLRNVTVSYDNASNNDDKRDAFFACETIEVKGNQTFEVTLKRPFAQINVGVTAEDWAAAKASGIEIEQSKVVIKNAATNLDLLDGTVSGSKEVTYALEDIISDQTLDVDLNGDDKISDDEKYKWLSMSYILVDESTTGAAKTNLESLEFTFKPKNGNNIVFKEGLTSVPVQRNWRTNIIGQILTGEITFKVKIDKEFLGDHNVNIVRDEDNKITYVNDVPYKDNAVMYQKADGTYAGATTLSAAINSAPAGSVITLGAGADITLSATSTTQIDKNLTISGLSPEESSITGAILPTAKFVSGSYTSPKVTLENVTVKWNGAGEGALVLKNEGKPELTMNNCVIDGNNNTPSGTNGLISLQKSYKVNIDGCTFKGTGNNAWGLAQTIAGTSDSYATITNCNFQTCGLLLTTGNGNVEYLKVQGNTFGAYRGLQIDKAGTTNKWQYIWIENNVGKLSKWDWASETPVNNVYVKNNTTSAGTAWTLSSTVSSKITTDY